MYRFTTTKAYSDEGYTDWCCDTDTGADLDFTFDARLNQTETLA